MKSSFFTILIIILPLGSFAQLSFDSIHSDAVLYDKRLQSDHRMKENLIHAAFSMPLDSNSEDQYKEACWAVSQYLLKSDIIHTGFTHLLQQFNTLETATKRATLEAIYATCPDAYQMDISTLIQSETVPKLFAMELVYLLRNDASASAKTKYRNLITQKFSTGNNILIAELIKYLDAYPGNATMPLPPVNDLFQQESANHIKTIYSFQRQNRNYPGIAIVQLGDGHFARDQQGKLVMVEQLARSASNLPYFLTDGSTPQGIFRIHGTEISRNLLIGPTPNIQMVMPFEDDSIFWNHLPVVADTLQSYLHLLPASWQQYLPIREAFYAGKAGRSEIIAHGTTIDPDYYKGMPFYPLTPTMGCLCARENWNIFNGKLLESDQYRLISAFLQTPETSGFLIVINLDNAQKAVSKEDVEEMVRLYEQSR